MANNERSDMIEEALNKALSTMKEYQEGDILTEWVVVGYVSNPDKEKGGGYPMLYSNGDMPDHVARGLLVTGMEYLSLVGAFIADLDDEDDEE